MIANQPTDRRRSPLELQLINWAIDHWPEPVDAFMAKWGDWEFERKCLGAIFRRVARQGSPGAAYLYAVAESDPDQLLALAPYIGEVQMPQGPMPGPLGWPAWIKALQDIAAFDGKPWDNDRWAELVEHEKRAMARARPVAVEAKPAKRPAGRMFAASSAP